VTATKAYASNVAMRRRVIEASPSERAHLLRVFRDDPATFIDLCAWTYRVKTVDEATGEERPARPANWPFVLWPCQRRAVAEVAEGLHKGHDLVIRKSRDMGASWLVLATFVWGWLFHRMQLLLTSRVEDLVDRSGDPDSLFWKVDYIIGAMPAWLLPDDPSAFMTGGAYRSHLVLQHPDGQSIVGASATPHVGRGGRRHGALFDELSAMQDAESAWQSAEDTTPCRIALATPFGVGTHYARLVQRAAATGTPRLVTLMYWEHPEKGRGAEERIDADGRMTGHVGKSYVWTPWLEVERARRDSTSMAQNVFAEEIGSGAAFFDHRAVTGHLAKYARTPTLCELRGFGRASKMEPTHQGRISVYDDPAADRSRGAYAIGVDPSHGVGAANGCIAVVDVDRRCVVAEFACPHTRPSDLALVAVGLARGPFAGRGDPIIAWEVNGPGAGLQHDFEEAGYRRVYRMRQIGTSAESRSTRVGWHSQQQTKRALLADLSRGVSQGLVRIPSEACLREMLEYVITENGAIEAQSRADLASGAREAHGDRVIATALAFMAAEEGAVGHDAPPDVIPGSAADILKHNEVRA
jgi:hypothetical protein